MNTFFLLDASASSLSSTLFHVSCRSLTSLPSPAHSGAPTPLKTFKPPFAKEHFKLPSFSPFSIYIPPKSSVKHSSPNRSLGSVGSCFCKNKTFVFTSTPPRSNPTSKATLDSIFAPPTPCRTHSVPFMYGSYMKRPNTLSFSGTSPTSGLKIENGEPVSRKHA